MPNLVDLFSACRRFVDLVEARNDTDRSGLVGIHLALLDLVRLAMSDLESAPVPVVLAPRTPRLTRAELAPRFRELGFYWVVLEPLRFDSGPEFGTGDAMDDLLDTYSDVHDALKTLADEGQEEALWKIRFDFRYHWGEHAHGLGRYLHWIATEQG